MAAVAVESGVIELSSTFAHGNEFSGVTSGHLSNPSVVLWMFGLSPIREYAFKRKWHNIVIVLYVELLLMWQCRRVRGGE